MRPAALTSGALLAIAALLSGCSTVPGPLGASAPVSGGNQACAPARPGQWVSDGNFALENHSKSAVTILAVQLAHASHMRMMTTAWLVPVYTNPKGTHILGTGIGFSWPPTGIALTPTWADRRPAVGGVIRPGETIGLAFGAMRTSATLPGRSAGALVAYSAGGSNFTVLEGPALTLADKC